MEDRPSDAWAFLAGDLGVWPGVVGDGNAKDPVHTALEGTRHLQSAEWRLSGGILRAR